MTARLAGLLALLVAAPALAQPRYVEVAVEVIEVRPHPGDKGMVARLEADIRRMLHRSRRVVLQEKQYHMALGQTVHLLLPNGCEAAITPTALEANDFVRMHLSLKAPTQFDLDLSVKSGGSFNVGAGRSTNGHLLLMISPHGP
ncbi:MAG TPA: hypothetical protein VMB50_12045 [Myxococcales bacterium]|nr:hypothetical protein [Myxococcales bacterium]